MECIKSLTSVVLYQQLHYCIHFHHQSLNMHENCCIPYFSKTHNHVYKYNK